MQLKHGFIVAFFVTDLSMAQQWQTIDTNSNVQLSKRTLSNGLFEVKAQFEICSTLSGFINLLRDTDIAPQWIHHAQRVEFVTDSLAQHLPYVDIIHTYFEPPWPARKRDMVTRSTISQDVITAVITISIEDLGRTVSEVDGYVRMTDLKGTWELTPTKNGHLTISYSGSGDPAGLIPHWLANKLLVTSTMNTFENLVRLLPNSTYQEHTLQGIIEPPGCK